MAPEGQTRMNVDTSALAAEVAARVTAATSPCVALVGLIGVVAGALITVVGTLLRDHLQARPRRELDKQRKKVLLEMLRDKRFDGGWQKLATMSRVVGADEEATKRLLFEVGARGSERDDGMWGLIENHPFDKVDQ
jgi:hypothetical protein